MTMQVGQLHDKFVFLGYLTMSCRKDFLEKHISFFNELLYWLNYLSHQRHKPKKGISRVSHSIEMAVTEGNQQQYVDHVCGQCGRWHQPKECPAFDLHCAVCKT